VTCFLDKSHNGIQIDVSKMRTIRADSRRTYQAVRPVPLAAKRITHKPQASKACPPFGLATSTMGEGLWDQGACGHQRLPNRNFGNTGYQLMGSEYVMALYSFSNLFVLRILIFATYRSSQAENLINFVSKSVQAYFVASRSPARAAPAT
jgi:hypothetical protein